MELQAQVNLLICLLISAWQANGDERLFGKLLKGSFDRISKLFV